MKITELLNRKFEMTEERVSKREDISIEIMQPEEQRENKFKNIKHRSSGICRKSSNVYVYLEFQKERRE